MAAKINHVDQEELSTMEEGRCAAAPQPSAAGSCSSAVAENAAQTLQKLLGEAIGTYFIVFTGCAAIVVDKTNGSITYPGICVTWGLIIMIVVYSLAHISGAHFNPAVTITFAIFRGFPLKQVPLYIVAQVTGSILASGTLCLLLDITPETYFGSRPSGSDAQAVVMEIIIGFILMFVIFGTAFDERAHKEFAPIAIGMTVLLNALIAGTISGASMNPARSIGPAVVKHVYKGLWIYVVGPTVGCLAGGATYSLVKHMDQLPSLFPNHKLQLLTTIVKSPSIIHH
ncbi:hypothetical protein Ancab_006417 [Ancistrocladus abbreviatus]